MSLTAVCLLCQQLWVHVRQSQNQELRYLLSLPTARQGDLAVAQEDEAVSNRRWQLSVDTHGVAQHLPHRPLLLAVLVLRTRVGDFILLYDVVEWEVITLMYYTEFMLFGIYFMLFHVRSSDSRLILLSAWGGAVSISVLQPGRQAQRNE